MPDQKISQLTGGGAAQATDEIPIARSGSNFKLTGANLGTALERIAASGQSLTGSQATSLVDLAATWNTTGTPSAIKLNVTNTASNANSRLMDLQVSATSRFAVNRNGSLILGLPTNLGALPVFNISTAAYNLNYVPANVGFEFDLSGVTALSMTRNSTPVVTVLSLGVGATDTVLVRDAADALAQRRTTNAQTFRVYNTFTDASNYERTAITSATHSGAKYQQLLAESAGTGAANLGVVIQPKGTGAFSLHMPDGTATGGNARGSRAVDLQLSRGAATQVASGTSSFVLGENCTASTTRAFAMGFACTSSGNQSFALGNNCAASSSNTFAINESTGATAQAAFASGIGSSASATAATSMGERGVADKRGQFAVGAGFFSAFGDSQWSVLGFRGSTTNATITEIFLTGLSNTRATVPASTTWVAEVDVIARSTGGTSNACFKRRCIIKRDGANNTALVGSVETIGTDIGSNAGVPPTGWAVTITADDTNESLKVEVTGAASTTINWVAKASLVEVGLA